MTSTCKNAIPMVVCRATGQPCPHAKVSFDGECNLQKCENETIPTFDDILDIYITAIHREYKRIGTVKSNIKVIVNILGMTMQSRVAISYEEIDKAVELMKKKYSMATIKGIFNSLSACLSSKREMKYEYKKRGFQIPDIDLPTIPKQHKDAVELTPEQRLKIKDKMSSLRVSTTLHDRNMYIWLWFAWIAGARPSDICRLTWSAITVRTNGQKWVDFVPHKTEKTMHHAAFPLDEEEYAMILPFIGNPNDYVISRHENRTPKSGCVKITNGAYQNHHRYLRFCVCEFMRSIGVNNLKPGYALRADCSQQAMKNHGPLYEKRKMCHNTTEAFDHYVNLHTIDIKEGL